MIDLKSKIMNLPSLGTITTTHNLTPYRALGQNFLFDLNLTRKIAKAAKFSSNETIIEIGPGPGGLTRSLLLEGADNIIAIEKDTRAISALTELVTIASGKLILLNEDALKVSISIMGSSPRRIIANLPYNIATKLIINWLRTPTAFQSITVMVQKEVAQRICAEPKTSEYGRLSIITQWLAQPRILFDVPPGAFYPIPKVTSTLIEIIPRPEPLFLADRKTLEIITAFAFGQRRKMLRSSLKKIGGEYLLSATNIDPTKRPEELSIEDFCQLARAYATIN
ncbi:MAG: 16S rRNA (adenine(1518)-N(6)/adenine(1519)-N(6))-dimethyltransferase RsmA [Alphaproteobacteria bacterium]|nr:16S rRNA (adenine(1518)-N(6)/adenine(1519)-N(6))-dimethyltransferase RsmA [Alphaproteobacteria bacterium]